MALHSPLLVIVSGPPCTGKTTLGRRLAHDLALPFVAKDDIKERLFDSLGWSDRDWSSRLGVATYSLLLYIVEMHIAAGHSLVTESNFHPEIADPQFRALAARHPFHPIQIQCQADGQVLIDRWMQRSESKRRHPGHVDHLNLEAVRPFLERGRHDNLDIGGEVIEVDTTDFARIDYDGLLERVRGQL